MTTDPTFGLALQEVWRLTNGQAPSDTPKHDFGPFEEMIGSVRLAWEAEAEACVALNREVNGSATKEARQSWADWSKHFPELTTALQQVAVDQPETDAHSLQWLKDAIALIPAGKDGVELRKILQPTITKIVGLPDDVVVVACLEELRRYFQWKRETFTAYQKLIQRLRSDRSKADRAETDDVDADTEELGETVPPPIFLSPAMAAHNGIVYISHKMAFKATKRSKHGAITTTVWKPVLISSDRRRILPQKPPEGADVDSVWWLDESQRLALSGGFEDAPEKRWSYDSIVGFLNGSVSGPKPHEVFDALMASLKRYIYHADEYSYVVDVLWAMGTYFYRLWNAYPYLALHGERGAGKSTLLAWLAAVCFNAEFVVNTSEASLYRSIQAKAPTLLIDEQEGLNSSKAAKETKADLMGILKSGYKTGARVARQRMDRPELTEYFDVYSPKALAAIELFEDVLENRTILTFMAMKPRDHKTDDDGAIVQRDATEFAPLRDQLYLLLMHEAANVTRISERVSFAAINRFRELFRPLYTIAALVDASRGGERQVLDILDVAADAKARIRIERDGLSPEATLRQTLLLLCEFANDDASDFDRATLRSDGMVLVDTIQIKHTFESLYSSREQSFYNDTWLGKQVMKVSGISKGKPDRRWRKFEDRNPVTYETTMLEKYVSCYVLDPELLKLTA